MKIRSSGRGDPTGYFDPPPPQAPPPPVRGAWLFELVCARLKQHGYVFDSDLAEQRIRSHEFDADLIKIFARKK